MMFVDYELESTGKWSPHTIPLFAFGGVGKTTNALFVVGFTLLWEYS